MKGSIKESLLEPLDETTQRRFHLRVWFTSGMGFFTDAYDLWIIGVALLFITAEFKPSPEYIGLLISASLFGAFLGPLVFGAIGDLFGRKYAYGLEMVILTLGAIASALAPTFMLLILARFVMGIGIGGDYPTSATIMSEYSNRANRGRLVALVFALQGIGILAGIGVAFGLLTLNLNTDVIWRIMLGLGAVPASLVIYFRRKIPETPRYSIATGDIKGAKTAVEMVTGKEINIEGSYVDKKSRLMLLREYAPLLIGTSATWLLFDISYYGTGIFTPTLVQTFGFVGYLAAIKASALIFALAAVPGYFLAAALIDFEGRKLMQTTGFFAVGVLFFILSLFGTYLRSFSSLFIWIYALTFFFSNFGPNTTTFVYPTEIFPTRIRSTAHGISASMGKLGAALSTLIFPIMLSVFGKYNLMAFLGVISITGGIITIILLPETKGESLEAASKENKILIIKRAMPNGFEVLLENIDKGTKLLSDLIEKRVDANDALRRSKIIEHNGDLAVQNIFATLDIEDVPIINRIDIVSLASNLDDVLDMTEATIYRFYLYKIRDRNKIMREFSSIIRESTNLIHDGINNVSELSDNKTERFERITKRIHKLENIGDDLLREALAKVFDQPNAVTIIKYKDLYEHLEIITDKCNDVADIFRDFIIKYARY